MKRSIVAICLSVVSVCGVGTAGCSREPSRPQDRVEQSGWTLPPMIHRAERQEASLHVHGQAAPGGRIVLRGTGSTAYAVSADDQGQFEVRIAVPPTDTLFVIETQSGQVGSPAPYRLLVSTDPAGPIALVGSGVASIRLDPKSGLDVVDGDGQAMIASGRTTANRQFDIVIKGKARTVLADSTGRWSSVLTMRGEQSFSLVVAEQSYAVPGMNPAFRPQLLSRDGQGWRLIWAVSPDIRQSSWFPDQR